ncbi:hypothetical protein F7D13_12235 [Methylocystis rosea]|uniref:Holin n=1 Tax=Methylocystis rosea TaxID=173366 RepID=A0ABX6EMQ4_9HYPH|nr:hypothetical protein [Methylocystis rosea]QGM94726.1 hypothetical protein F7D13_12235 [Methylocystis rosea]
MPTPTCHSLSRMIVDSLFQTTSDKIAWVAAAGGMTAPAIADYLHGINGAAVWLGPPLAAIFIASKILLTWVQIKKEWWLKEKRSD